MSCEVHVVCGACCAWSVSCVVHIMCGLCCVQTVSSSDTVGVTDTSTDDDHVLLSVYVDGRQDPPVSVKVRTPWPCHV